MNLRENAMAIYNRRQPDYYFDMMDALELIPDPVLMGGFVSPGRPGAQRFLGNRLYF